MMIYGGRKIRGYIQSSQLPGLDYWYQSLYRLGRTISATLADVLPPPLLRVAHYLSVAVRIFAFALYRWGVLLLVAALAASIHLAAQSILPTPTAPVKTPFESTRVFPASPTVAPTEAPPRTLTPENPNQPTPNELEWQPTFPIRAAFYYPWFPEAWKQSGFNPYTNFTPTLGFYSSRDAEIIQQHIDMMEYGHIAAGIASWWGPGSQTDSKIAGLLQAAEGTHFRWALYYENEGQGNPSADKIRSDLAYIQEQYAADPVFLKVDGKFVVFVYSDGSDRCGMADRWKQANTVNAYIVLRIFPGYALCASQPDGWHQYAPAAASISVGDISQTISPGFWLRGGNIRLDRNVERWTRNVQDLVASGAQWQLISTFNEWGEGTAVEPAEQWSSSSGYGLYLDVLHSNGGESSP
jgi:hypothetical protein